MKYAAVDAVKGTHIEQSYVLFVLPYILKQSKRFLNMFNLSVYMKYVYFSLTVDNSCVNRAFLCRTSQFH